MAGPPIPRLLVVGYYGFHNAGDEAILGGMLRDLRARLPRAHFAATSGDPAHTSRTHAVEAVPIADLPALVEAVRRADLVLVGGGGILHDYWGADPSAILTPHHSQIPFFAGPALLAAALGKPVMLYAVGAGPLATDEGKRLATELAGLASAITVRDEGSARILADFGVARERILVAADPAWLLEPVPAETTDRVWSEEPLPAGGVLGLCLRHWDIGAHPDDWEPEVADAVAAFAARHDLSILLLPFQTLAGRAEDDRAVAARMAERLAGLRARAILGECSPEELAGLIGRCDLLLGMRLHSLLFAAIAGTPFVGLAYDPKVSEFARTVSSSEFVLPLAGLSREALVERLERAWAERAAISAKLASMLPAARSAASLSADRAFELLGGAAKTGDLRHAPLVGKVLAEAVVRAEGQSREAEALRGQLVERKVEIAALAARVAEEQAAVADLYGRLEVSLGEIEGLRAAAAEREAARIFLAAEVSGRDRVIASRDEGIAWLRGELDAARGELDVARGELDVARGELDAARGELLAIRRSKWWRLASRYWAVHHRLAEVPRALFSPRHAVGKAVRRLLPRRTKFLLKEFVQRRQANLHLVVASPAVVLEDAAADSSSSRLPQLGIQPALSPDAARLLADGDLDVPTARVDVVCFSIVDWDFRFQRPQQLMAQFGRRGHRVFFLRTTSFLPPDARPRFRLRPVAPNVFEVELAAEGTPNVYGPAISGQAADVLLDALDELRREQGIETAIGVAQVPAWGGIAVEARRRWDWPVIYDCMDDWEHFPGHDPRAVADEARLAEVCDLMLVSGKLLHEKWSRRGKPALIVRNAADVEFFCRQAVPNDLLRDAPHPIVGYFGAIADWFDVELVRCAAARRPGWTFVLLGGVFDVDLAGLRALPNVRLLGNQPYAAMPLYLHHFDACIIPFKIGPLTHATDPVKVYEYLSLGKPVVSVALAELEPHRALVYLARDRDEFLALLDRAVAEADPAKVARRKEFAARNTWADRYSTIARALPDLFPRVSVVVVTYGNLPLTRLCLESLLVRTRYPNVEVVVVDNASDDGTPDYLRRLSTCHPNVNAILNDENRGFACANNQGLRAASGEYLVLLNNDTVVPPGWLGGLVRHLSDPAVGLVGPVTNFAGNEAKVPVSYRTWEEMESFAARRGRERIGERFDIRVLAMYCVAFRREVLERVGMLDEQFEVGMFEDDDYANRVRQAGYRVVCAEDVFVHHFGQAAFGALIRNGQYDRLFDLNRRRFEAKWGTAWTPHQPRSWS